MRFIADLHIHSRFSRACSKDITIKNLEKYAKIKGVTLLGTGDFTHPEWIKELKSELSDDGTGILRTKTGFPFVLQTEVSLMYSQGGKGRKVHNLVLAPSFEVVDQITDYLKKHGRVDYDGRPIFGMSCIEFTESLMGISKDIEIIPAHCLVPDSIIHTYNGLKKIKEVIRGESVLTHRGRYKRVQKVYKRKFSGQIIQIVPSCLKIGTYFTPEHPIYSIKSFKSCKNVSHTICKPTCAYLRRGCKIKAFQNYKPEWNQVKDLEKGDIILYPRYNKIKEKPFVYLSNLVPLLFKEGSYVKSKNIKASSKNILIKNKIKISKDFCRLIGYYLAEGYCTRDYIGFTFSENETEYLEDVKCLLMKVFGDFIKIQVIKESSKGISLIIYSKILSDFFKIFYTTSYRSINKYIPDWIIDLTPTKLKELILGWWRGDTGYTSSVNLCNQFKLIFIKLGIIPYINAISAESINNRRETKPNLIGQRRILARNDVFQFKLSFFKDCYGLDKLPEFRRFITKLNRRKGWIDRDYIYLPLIKIKRKLYNGLVYNLEVETDNSYLTENLAVHNCWTPWFSIFGSKSGFDSVEECFKDQAKHIHALETGLSSDPELNWRLSRLDRFALVSFSDSHSLWPWRLGREATVFDIEPAYKNLINALRTKQGLASTIEVDPSYGKYHYDGHRICGICFEPKESIKHHDICPKCKRPLTIGVLNRIEQLADRPLGFKPKDAVPFKRLLPLSEILSNLLKKGMATKTIWEEYYNLLKLGSELEILLDAKYEELVKVTKEKIADAIIKNRNQEIVVKPGYDGVYGIPIFDANEIQEPIKASLEPGKDRQTGLNDFKK